MRESGLREAVASEISQSGVVNPVTAVLLNFRGYDTLLEMGVLLLALVGVWSLSSVPLPRQRAAGAVLEVLMQALIPVMLLVAGYLLWVGGSAPGGAFQAGAVLAAAGVLALLAGQRFQASLANWPLRVLIVSGLAIFVTVAGGVMVGGARLLEYPLQYAGSLILLIEAAATVSIGAILTVLFLGGRPTGKGGE